MTDIQILLEPILEFLPCPTPQAWIDEAIKPENLPILLIDHANNELKASQSAIAIISRYRNGISRPKDNKDDRITSAFSELKAAQSAMAIMSRYRTGKFAQDRGRSTNDEETGGLQLKPEDQLSLLNKMSRLAREELRHYEQVLAIMAQREIPYTHLGAGRYAGELSSTIRTYEPARLVDTLIMGAFIEARSCERFAALSPWLDDELKKFYQSLLKSESRHFQDYLTLAEVINGSDIGDRVNLFAGIEQDAILSPDQNFRFHSGIPG